MSNTCCHATPRTTTFHDAEKYDNKNTFMDYCRGAGYTTPMPKVLTVSQFVEAIRGLLRETIGVVTVQGEVSGYRTPKGTLVYFELTDDQTRVLCFGLSHEVRQALADGMEVRVTGTPSLFKQSGGFHLRVIEVELIGEGALRKAFEALQRTLEVEGLFRPERKRPLPQFPQTIGLITSPDAAAYADVLRILRNRWPLVQVKFAAVAVQGAGAVRQIVKALEHFSSQDDIEVVIVTRGGGSLDDFQAFNDEAVARAVFASRHPVVVGVGHERDITIADLVADARASTPSNAAERVVPDRAEILHRIDVMSGRLSRRLASVIEAERYGLHNLLQRLRPALERQSGDVRIGIQRFVGAVRAFRHRLENVETRRGQAVRWLEDAMTRRLSDGSQQLVTLRSLLHSLSPLAILQRGYSLTKDERGRIVRRSTELHLGERIRSRFGTGEATSDIREVL